MMWLFTLHPTMANSFLCYHEKKRFDNCPVEFNPVFYRQYVDGIFVLFKKEEHLKLFLNFFNSCHESIKCTSESFSPTPNYLSLILKHHKIEISLLLQFTVNPHLDEHFHISIVSFLDVTNSA